MIKSFEKLNELRLKSELGIYIDHKELPEGIDMIGKGGFVLLVEKTFKFISWEEYDTSIKKS